MRQQQHGIKNLLDKAALTNILRHFGQSQQPPEALRQLGRNRLQPFPVIAAVKYEVQRINQPPFVGDFRQQAAAQDMPPLGEKPGPWKNAAIRQKTQRPPAGDEMGQMLAESGQQIGIILQAHQHALIALTAGDKVAIFRAQGRHQPAAQAQRLCLRVTEVIQRLVQTLVRVDVLAPQTAQHLGKKQSQSVLPVVRGGDDNRAATMRPQPGRGHALCSMRRPLFFTRPSSRLK